MEWQDHGTVLTVRRHGETSAIVEVFTEAHGRHAGVVRGASSRRMQPVLQPGSQVAADLARPAGGPPWQLHHRAAAKPRRRDDGRAGWNWPRSTRSPRLLSFTLPEREAHPRFTPAP